MTDGLSQSLRSIGLFDGLGADVLAGIEENCKWVKYSSGSTIVDFLDSDDSVCFLIEGQAREVIYSSNGKSTAFRELVAGQWFGEYDAVDGLGRSARVEATEDCVVVRLPADKFRDLVDNDPQVSMALILHLVAQLRKLTARVYEFSTLAVKARVHSELLRLVRSAGVTDNASTIKNPPTHLQIAHRISTHREAVTRELNHLSKIGLVERVGNSLVVRDVQQLEDFVEAATSD